MFTDDDLIKPGAVKQVLQEISKGHNLIIVNSEVWNKDFTMLISGRHLSDGAQAVYMPNEFDYFFEHCIYYLSFIGSVVIRRSIWKERDKSTYNGTEFVHIGVIFQKRFSGTIGIIKEPYIKIRYGNAMWALRKFEIWMLKWPRLLWSFDAISEASRQRIVSREPWRKFKFLCVYRSLDAFNSEILKSLVSSNNVSYPWLFCAKCIALFPVKLASRMLIKYYAIKGKAKNLNYYDLLELLNQN